MRASFLAAVPLLAALAAVPVEGQVSARMHVDIPIGRSRPVAGYQLPRGPIVVREYDPYRYGASDSYFDQWAPQTLYLYNGYYYDYPVVAYAEPIMVYSYRNEFFFAPRDRGFIQWRDQRVYRNYGQASRPSYRDNHVGRSYPALRDDRQYRPIPQGMRNGRDVRPAPQNGREVHPALQGGRSAPPVRAGNRSRPQGHH
jgi:hypothetical protein